MRSAAARIAVASSRMCLVAAGVEGTSRSCTCAIITGGSASAWKPPPSRTMRAPFEAAATTDGSSTHIGTR